jgi:hypothetical protein
MESLVLKLEDVLKIVTKIDDYIAVCALRKQQIQSSLFLGLF